MIGFYNYTVILTYMGFVSAIMGIISVISGNGNGHCGMAVICLMISGLCDMFDGKVARTMQRTEPQKKFGIQIDSLSDLVCFGVLPSVIGYGIGLNKFWHSIILAAFPLAALIRLAYFNVMEEERQKISKGVRKTYEGLPVTSVALILPLLYCFKKDLGLYFPTVYAAALVIIGAAFLIKFNIRKPKGKIMLCMLFAGILEFLLLIIKRVR